MQSVVVVYCGDPSPQVYCSPYDRYQCYCGIQFHLRTLGESVAYLLRCGHCWMLFGPDGWHCSLDIDALKSEVATNGL